MITWDNYEEYMVMHTDGELQAHEEQALQAFIEQNPQLKHELAMYNSVRMIPDTMVYEQKQSLMKPEPAGRKIAFVPAWRTIGLAAGLAAIIITSVALLNQEAGTTAVNPVAKKTNATSITTTPVITPSVAVAPVATTETTTATAPTAPATEIPENNRTKNRSKIEKTAIANNKTRNTTPAATTGKIETAYATAKPLQLQLPQTSPVQMLPVEKVAFAAMPLTAIDEYAAAPQIETKQSWLDKLPIDDLKKQGLENAGTALSNGYDHLTKIKHNITATSLSVRVEKRKLILSF